jgi:DNA-binding NarL/FixJ family response regulator
MGTSKAREAMMVHVDGSVRVLIVEDSPLIRLRLRRSLSEIPGLELAGEADSAVEALQLIRRDRPEVVVLDMSLREGSGYLVLRRMQQEKLPGTAVVLTSEPAYRGLCLEAGAYRFFDKGREFTCFLDIMKGLAQRTEEGSHRARKSTSAPR